jgi:peptidoglycan/xylan/chitin deacetylase (PgdA/CDA1 family)
MRSVVRMMFVGSIATALACGGDDPTGSPNFSINGGKCSKTANVTLEEQAGPTMRDKTIAFTFDDGPSEITADLSSYLKSQGIKATFFINGANAEGGGEEILDQQVDDGHLLANHTHTHAALPELNAKQIVDEVDGTDQLLSGRVPAGKLFFRPPFGAWSDTVQKAIAGSGMQKYIGPVFWDIGDAQTETTAADWDCWEDNGNGTRSVKECGDFYLKEIQAKKRGIVLMHDGPPNAGRVKTLQMVKYLVPLLKADGYKFSRVDEVPLTPLGHAATPENTGPTGAGTATGGGGTVAQPGIDPCK